jgi:hypothetical protein
MKLLEIFVSEAETVSHVYNVIPGMTLQPLKCEEMAFFQNNGGNCPVIVDGDWPLVGEFFFISCTPPMFEEVRLMKENSFDSELSME